MAGIGPPDEDTARNAVYALRGKREREELAKREAEEARARIEKENYRRFRAAILELAANGKTAAKGGRPE